MPRIVHPSTPCRCAADVPTCQCVVAAAAVCPQASCSLSPSLRQGPPRSAQDSSSPGRGGPALASHCSTQHVHNNCTQRHTTRQKTHHLLPAATQGAQQPNQSKPQCCMVRPMPWCTNVHCMRTASGQHTSPCADHSHNHAASSVRQVCWSRGHLLLLLLLLTGTG